MLRNRDIQAMLITVEILMRDSVSDLLAAKRVSSRSLDRLFAMKQVHGRLRRALENRQAEAANRVVDFGRWVTAHGALRGWRRDKSRRLST